MMKRPLRPRIGYDEQIFPKPGDYDALKSEEWDMEQEQQLQDWLKPQEQGHPKIRERPVAYRQSKGSRTGHSLPKEKLGGIGLPSWLTKSLEDVYREKYGGRYPGLAENVAAGVGTGLKAIGLPKHIAETTGRNITSLAEDWTPAGALTATEEYGPLGALAALPLVGGKAKKAAKLARGLGEVSEHLPNVERPLASVTDVEKPRPVKSNGSVKKAGPMNVEAPVGSVKDVTGPSTAGGLGGSSKPKGPMNVEVPSGSTVDQTDTAPAMGVKGSVRSKASNTEIPISSKVDTVAPKGLGIRAYHGSPHSFEEFDISKIGTGEGVQAYGHGLYFAENEKVAQDYRNKLADDYLETGDGKIWSPDSLEHLNVRVLMRKSGDVDEALAKARDLLPSASEQTRPMLEGDIAVLEGLKARGGVKTKPSGSMYEVNIDADPEAFLDWDRPLSEQSPNVREQLGGLGSTQKNRSLAETDVGKDVYYKQTQGLTSAGATERLKEAGIPGIRYLDQGSRWTGDPVDKIKANLANAEKNLAESGNKAYWQAEIDAHKANLAKAEAKQDTRNYVVFDPKIISIVRRYGIAGALGMGLISEEMARQLEAQGEL